MARFERFTFLCDEKERRAITCLAERLARSQSDAVRFVVVEAERQLSLVKAAPTKCEAFSLRNLPTVGKGPA